MRLLVILATLIAIPVVEIYVIIQIGQEIGVVPTIVLLLVESMLGAWLVKHEGRRAWLALHEAIQTGQMPGRELADAALLLVGGTLLLTPGFVTDVFGFFFVLPFTRPLARRILAYALRSRVVVGTRHQSQSAYAATDHGVHQIYHEDPPGR